MVRRALKLQRTCRPLTINEPYRQACGMALEKYFQQKNCPRQSPLQRCRASRRFLFLSTHHKLSSPAAGAEGIHKWSVDVPREEKIFGRPFPRKRLSSKRSAFKPFSMMNWGAKYFFSRLVPRNVGCPLARRRQPHRIINISTNCNLWAEKDRPKIVHSPCLPYCSTSHFIFPYKYSLTPSIPHGTLNKYSGCSDWTHIFL